MSWSLGEIRALSTKAAKGAGFSWGEAEEAGFAVEWLEARCMLGVEALAHYLTSNMNATTCPIKIGCQISDFGSFDNILPTDMCQPLLLAPFISNVLHTETITLQTNNTAILVSHMDIYANHYDPSSYHDSLAVSIMNAGIIPDDSSCKSRIDVSQQAFVKTLEQFAHKTYAPATEASRFAGAGAGITDND